MKTALQSDRLDRATPQPRYGLVAVAMSGGVDSSVVAALLQEQARQVVGLTMQLWNQRRLPTLQSDAPKQHRCCSIDDVYDARRVAETIGIPYYVVNHEDRFERDVVRPFVQEYLSGRTPIPCSLCNNHLKFDQLLTVAQQIGAEAVATGHYARAEFDESSGRWLLKRPADHSKDQTYFLFGLTQEQMAQRTGKDRSSVANYLRLLRLPEPVQGLVESNQITFGHAKALMGLDSAEAMLTIADRVIVKSLSVRQTEDAVAHFMYPAQKSLEKDLNELKARAVDPNVKEAENGLRRALGVKVTITDRKGKGKILLEYSSLEDFDRILSALAK